LDNEYKRSSLKLCFFRFNSRTSARGGSGRLHQLRQWNAVLRDAHRMGESMNQVLNRELFSLLEQNEVLKLKGYSLSFDQEGGIVIDRAGHVHGIWNHDRKSYTWVSPGNSEPKFRTENAKSAALYTVVVLAQE
jgi:hypothetical protein